MERIIEIWTIYDRPRDYPNGFIARKFNNNIPTKSTLTSDNLEALRDKFKEEGLSLICRDPSDANSIVESWIV